MRLFHNYGMSYTFIKPVSSNRKRFLGLGFCVLSILVHALFVTWAGGVVEIPSWSPPLRNNPIEVSLAIAPPIVPSVVQPASQKRPVAAKAVRVPRKVAAADAVNETVQSPNSSIDSAQEKPIPTNGGNVEPKAESTTIDETKPEPVSVPVQEVEKNKPELSEQAIYPGGLGAIPEAAAFAYTFYSGDYSLNNQLGAGSFIVEAGSGKYKLVLIGKASGLTSLIFSGATYRSAGEFGNDGFAPQIYAEKSGNRPERSAQVDYLAKEVTLGDQKKPTLLGMQDRVSVIWQVGLILRAKPEFAEAGKTLPIPLMSTRGLDNAQFISQGVVDIDKRGVMVKAVHFKFKPANPQNRAQMDLWYDLNNLPQPLRVRWVDERDRTLDIFRDQ